MKMDLENTSTNEFLRTANYILSNYTLIGLALPGRGKQILNLVLFILVILFAMFSSALVYVSG
jgi:hypothetical protein